MLARDQATLPVYRVAVAVQRGLAEHRDRSIRLVPAEHAVVRNVRPDQIASRGEPRRSFGPATSAVEFLDVCVSMHEPAIARIENFEIGREFGGHGVLRSDSADMRFGGSVLL